MQDNGDIDFDILNKRFDDEKIEILKHRVQIGQLRFSQYRVKPEECKRARAGSKVTRYAKYFKNCYPWYFNEKTMMKEDIISE